MDFVLLLARLVLAGVFLVAGIAKLADRRGSIQAMRDFGVPSRLASPLGIALPVAEVAVAIALIPTDFARWGAAGALVLLLAFVGGIGINLARGNTPDCHCFGQLLSEPVGRPTLVRNGALSAVAAFLLVAGRNNPGTSAIAWISDISTFERFMLLGSVLVLALLAGMGWLLVQVLQQNGRLLLRLDALESTVQSGHPTERLATGKHEPPSGLHVGTTAPVFTLPNLAGEPTSLADVLVAQTPTLLIFSDPGCGPCNALMPDIGQWQQQHGDTLSVVVVSRGDLAANRSKASEHGIRIMVLQQNREVAEAYQAPVTPSAVLISSNGTVGSLVAAGPDAIRQLVAGVTLPPRSLHAPNGNADAPARPDLIGKAVPDVTLANLEGGEVALSSYLGRPTALLFWNPGCGYCQRMLDDVKVFEADPPEGTPKVVVISTGDAERNRALGIQVPVLLDQGFSTGRQFGATGTPSAVLIDANGVVASPVAVGAPAILKLVGGARQEIGAD